MASPVTIWMVGLGVFLGIFIAINGFLIIFYPDSFLRFHDWYTPGDYVSKHADWRNTVHETQFRVVGVVALCFGAFVVVSLLRIVLHNWDLLGGR